MLGKLFGFGPKPAALVKTTILSTTYRLQNTTWKAFVATASPALQELAASTGAPGPQLIVQMVSEHEGASFLFLPAGSAAKAASVVHGVPSYASVVEPCLLPGSIETSTVEGYTWQWAAAAPGCTPVTVTRTSFDIKEGAFEDFVKQFGNSSAQMRGPAEEVGLLSQATFPSAGGKVTLLSSFTPGADGPKRMGPKLPELWKEMGLLKFLTAQPQIDTSEHGSWLAPVDSAGLSVGA
mmetsp:Transcript_29932/g.69959  ORF Transcript_29932/g.69959 Transcript_29932/m.69959 type:complete len:237 (-) Transcript_29932:619-1329(-)